VPSLQRRRAREVCVVAKGGRWLRRKRAQPERAHIFEQFPKRRSVPPLLTVCPFFPATTSFLRITTRSPLPTVCPSFPATISFLRITTCSLGMERKPNDDAGCPAKKLRREGEEEEEENKTQRRTEIDEIPVKVLAIILVECSGYGFVSQFVSKAWKDTWDRLVVPRHQ